jgi:hypothetical protein
MTTLLAAAEPAVDKLLQSDEDDLYEELGIRSRAMVRNLEVSASFSPVITAEEAVAMGPLDEAKKLGKKIFSRWNREAYHLVCGTGAEDEKDRSEIRAAFNIGAKAVATSLSGLLVSMFGLAPAIAAVIAALIIKRFFQGAIDETCAYWKGNLA